MKNSSNKTTNPIFRWIITVVVLFLLWIICSGIFEKKMLILGAFSSIVAATITFNALTVKGIKTDSSYFIMGFNPIKILVYFLWLIKEVILSAVYVSKVILFRREDINPAFCKFKADYDNPVARATLTDSITLTPGTITVNVDDAGIYTVHALTDEVRLSLLDGGMQRKVAETFGEEIDYSVIEGKLLWPDEATGVSIGSKRGKRVAGKIFR